MFFEPSLGVPHCRHFQKTPLSESLGSAGLSLCAKHGCMAEIGPGWGPSVWFVTGLRLQVLLVIVAASIPKNVPSKPMLSAFCHGNGWSMWDEVNANCGHMWPKMGINTFRSSAFVYDSGHWIGGQSHMAVVSALDKLGYPQVFRSFSDRFPIKINTC